VQKKKIKKEEEKNKKNRSMGNTSKKTLWHMPISLVLEGAALTIN
jgi:hypothetical protein